jgi:TonB family protein
LTPADGIDFGPYTHKLSDKVKQEWCAGPLYADLSGGAVATVEFSVATDGSLLPKQPVLEQASGNALVDRAALNAVVKAAPFDPLPADFHGKFVKFQIIFMRNQGVSFAEHNND